MASDGPFAALTLVTTDSYVTGARVSGASLRSRGWGHETVALVGPAVSAGGRRRLAESWDRLVEVEPIDNPYPAEERAFGAHADCFFKLRIWQRTEYSKVVYLDADTLVMGSLEELLDRPSFAAAPCAYSPDRLSAGVLVVDPSLQVFESLTARIGELPSNDASDMGFLNSYFSDWFDGPAARRLPQKFNVYQLTYFYAPAWRRVLGDARVLHYEGRHKPWRAQRSLLRRLTRRVLSGITAADAALPSPWELWWQAHDELLADRLGDEV